MFAPTHNVIREFLVGHRGTRIRAVQRSHLGQALVRFDQVHDLDFYVHHSPFQYGDVAISFQKHNEGRNYRSLNFNWECWLLLLGFPLDYWEHEYIDNAVASFGRLTFWEEDRRHMTRILIQARVTVRQVLLGGLPADEDPIPKSNQIQGALPFDFFGFGQQIQPQNQQVDHAQNVEEDNDDQDQWGQWLQNQTPNAAPAATDQEGEQQVQLFDLNKIPAQPEIMDVDAGEAPQLHLDLNMEPSGSNVVVPGVENALEENEVVQSQPNGLEVDLNIPQEVELEQGQQLLEAQQNAIVQVHNMIGQQVQAENPMLQVNLPLAAAEVDLMDIANNGMHVGEAYLELNDLLEPQLVNQAIVNTNIQEDEDLNILLNDINNVV